MINEIQIEKIQRLLDDESLLSAVKAVFDEQIDKTIPRVGITDDNVVLGEKYRAFITAKELLNNVFKELQSFKVNPKSKEDFPKHV